MPPLWWLSPWTFAVEQWNARARFYRYWQVAEEQRDTANAEVAAKTLRIKVTEQNIVDTANAAGFDESKSCYVIGKQPQSPFPLTWLGEAVAYWKGEAYAARRERDKAKDDHNAFQRQVEVTLINGGAPVAYENTIDLVVWAVDEIKRLRTELKDAKADKEEAEKHHAEEHKANVLLNDEVIRLKDEIFWLKQKANAKPKRKPRKKGGKR